MCIRDRSTLSFVVDPEGHATASVVDLTAQTITDVTTDTFSGAVSSVTRDVDDYPDEADPEDLPPDLTVDADDLNRRLRGGSTADPSDRNDRQLLVQEDGTQLDVLVLYTASAKQAKGGLDGMLRAINLAITETNAAYIESGVDTQLRLVHTHETSYVEDRGFSQALYDLQGQSDAYLTEAHNLRSMHKADLVALIINDPQYCGIAYMGPSFSYMFSVTSHSCMTGYYSFGHGAYPTLLSCPYIMKSHLIYSSNLIFEHLSPPFCRDWTQHGPSPRSRHGTGL